MLKWITYDGTGETLPKAKEVVLLIASGQPPFPAIYNDMQHCWYYRGITFHPSTGDSWLPIPTPADLEKWEALKRTAQAVYDEHIITDDCKTAQVREPLMYVLGSALAALAPKEEG